MLKEKIQNDLKEALKQKEPEKTSVLKMLLASIINAEIQAKKKEEGLEDGEIQKVVKSEAKKRQVAIEAYTNAQRPELAEKEKKELEILESYK